MIVILITAFATIRSAVEAIRIGAFDYLTKPIDKEELILALNRGLERISLLKENLVLKHKLEKFDASEYGDEDYGTSSPVVKTILSEAKKVAAKVPQGATAKAAQAAPAAKSAQYNN